MEIAKTIAPVCLAIIMFGLGLGLTTSDFSRVLKTPRDFFVGFLSSIIPGSGRIYSGRFFDGLIGLWTFYLTSSSAYFAIKDERTVAGPSLAIVATYVYLGEIYGAWRTAKYYQKSID